jgi:hypothetical protein
MKYCSSFFAFLLSSFIWGQAQAQFFPLGNGATSNISSGGDAFASPGGAFCASGFVLSSGNKTATINSPSGNSCGSSTTTHQSSGKYYFEAAVSSTAVFSPDVGIGSSSDSFINNYLGGGNSAGLVVNNGASTAQFIVGSAGTNVTQCFIASPSGQTVGIAVDFDANLIRCTLDGVNLFPSGGVALFSSTSVIPYVSALSNLTSFTLNTGGQAFTLGLPTGYSKWCSGSTC